MTCQELQKIVSAYVDRQLPSWQNVDVSDHIQTCSACDAELQTVIQLKRTLRAATLPRMPESVRASILAETIQKMSRRENWLAVRWWVPTFALASAAAGWLVLRAAESYMLKRIPEIHIADQRPHRAIPGRELAWHREPGAPSSKQTH